MYDPNDKQNEELDIENAENDVAEHVAEQIQSREPVTLDDEDSYSDAGYILSEEAPTMPRRYYTPPEKEEPKPKPEPKKKKHCGHGFKKVIVSLFVGALMGGIVGVGIMGAIDQREHKEELEEAERSIEAPAPVPSPALVINDVDTSVMSATDIYNIATSQAVGIRTEITGYNIFGQQTTNAVSGTGFIVSEDGYIMTNYHVIEDAYDQDAVINVILYNGDSYEASIVGYENSDSDIAVLKIEASGLAPAVLADSSAIQVGEDVYAVGNPLGELTYTMTDGMISALDRDISSQDSYGYVSTINMFQISAAVNSGNSGGPVYNSQGEVIGVVTAKYSSSGVEGLGFAIPINDAIDIANDLIERGYVSGKASIGVTVQNMSQNVANYYGVPVGAYVFLIEEGSCAERAGLLVGDIIVGIDDYEVTGNSDLKTSLKHYGAGDSAVLKVYRGTEYIDVAMTFDEAIPDTATIS